MSGATRAAEPPGVEKAEVRQVLGAADGAFSTEPLVHNPKNSVTLGVWRVRAGRESAILKVLSGEGVERRDAWAASDDPAHWNYWRRESLFYQSDLPAILGHAGLESPRLLQVVERTPSQTAIWLEDVEGRRGDVWSLDDHRCAARALGRAHGLAAARTELRERTWLSRRFLRAYSDKPVRWDLLEDDDTWRHPLVAECLGERVRESGRQLHAECEWLQGIMESLPRTLCHLDFWPMNLVRRHNGALVALDWGFLGDGAIGEDLGNHVPDSAFDLFVPSAKLRRLDEAAFAALLEGLSEAGWRGDERLVRLGVCASAVKYVWLLPLMLERALLEAHSAYGGGDVPDPRTQYRERGQTLNFLAGWVDEARQLARVTSLRPA